MLTRYAMIAGLAAITVFGAINFGSNNAGVMLVDASRSGLAANVPVWALALIVAAAIFSLCRETTTGMPQALDAWASSNKTWLFAGSGILVLAAYALS